MNHVLTLHGPIPVVGFIEGDRITITKPGHLINPQSRKWYAAMRERSNAKNREYIARKKKERLDARKPAE